MANAVDLKIPPYEVCLSGSEFLALIIVPAISDI
jgi:hypothetical protein